MLEALINGALLGLAAGFTPGPLTVLVISTTLRYSAREGAKVALAPIITDLPIIAASTFLIELVGQYQGVLGVVSLIGAAFVIYLGNETLRVKGIEVDESAKPSSFRKGILTNLLSPNPYLFWFTIGVALISKHSANSWTAAAGFVISLFAFLVGSKIVLAIIAGRAKHMLTGKLYIWTMRFLGLALIVLSIFLIRDGLRLLDW